MSTDALPVAKRILTVVCFHGNKWYDDAMHAADLFERFKAFAEAHVYEMKVPADLPIAQVIETFRRSVEASGERVVAIFAPYCAEGAWRDETVTVTSNGKQWGMLEPQLARFGYTAATPVAITP